MKPIIQEQPAGCAVACVAYLTKTSYKNAIKFFNKPQNAVIKGFYCKDIVQALKKVGFNYTYKKYKKTLLRNNSIVFIKKSRKHPLGHYLVETKNGWLNPWINFPNMNPVIAGYSKKLSSKAQWIIFPK